MQYKLLAIRGRINHCTGKAPIRNGAKDSRSVAKTRLGAPKTTKPTRALSTLPRSNPFYRPSSPRDETIYIRTPTGADIAFPSLNQAEEIISEISKVDLKDVKVEVNKVLGHGAFGVVYAVDIYGKVFTGGVFKGAAKMSRTGNVCKQEMIDLLSLTDQGSFHPTIPEVYSIGSVEAVVAQKVCLFGSFSPTLRPEKVTFNMSIMTRHGVNLHELLKTAITVVGSEDEVSFLKGLPVDVVVNFAIQIYEGLKYLHKNGMSHRDIKADNILVKDENAVRNVQSLMKTYLVDSRDKATFYHKLRDLMLGWRLVLVDPKPLTSSEEVSAQKKRDRINGSGGELKETNSSRIYAYTSMPPEEIIQRRLEMMLDKDVSGRSDVYAAAMTCMDFGLEFDEKAKKIYELTGVMETGYEDPRTINKRLDALSKEEIEAAILAMHNIYFRPYPDWMLESLDAKKALFAAKAMARYMNHEIAQLNDQYKGSYELKFIEGILDGLEEQLDAVLQNKLLREAGSKALKTMTDLNSILIQYKDAVIALKVFKRIMKTAEEVPRRPTKIKDSHNNNFKKWGARMARVFRSNPDKIKPVQLLKLFNDRVNEVLAKNYQFMYDKQQGIKVINNFKDKLRTTEDDIQASNEAIRREYVLEFADMLSSREPSKPTGRHADQDVYGCARTAFLGDSLRHVSKKLGEVMYEAFEPINIDTPVDESSSPPGTPEGSRGSRGSGDLGMRRCGSSDLHKRLVECLNAKFVEGDAPVITPVQKDDPARRRKYRSAAEVPLLLGELQEVQA